MHRGSILLSSAAKLGPSNRLLRPLPAFLQVAGIAGCRSSSTNANLAVAMPSICSAAKREGTIQCWPGAP